MTDVLFPALSKETPDAEGVLATWFVSEGSTVAADQLIAEVQVDKVSAEVVAPDRGSRAPARGRGGGGPAGDADRPDRLSRIGRID